MLFFNDLLGVLLRGIPCKINQERFKLSTAHFATLATKVLQITNLGEVCEARVETVPNKDIPPSELSQAGTPWKMKKSVQVILVGSLMKQKVAILANSVIAEFCDALTKPRTKG